MTQFIVKKRKKYSRLLNSLFLVACLISLPPSPAQGINVNFNTHPNGALSLVIDGPKKKWQVRETRFQDLDFYRKLFSDTVTMETLSPSGVPFSDSTIMYLHKIHWQNWRQGIPGRVVLESEGQVIGYADIRAVKDSSPRETEISFAILSEFRGKGWGTRFVSTIVNDYIPALNQQSQILTSPFQRLYARVTITNPASLHLLDQLGFVAAPCPQTLDETLHRLKFQPPSSPREIPQCPLKCIDMKGRFLSRRDRIDVGALERNLVKHVENGMLYTLVNPRGIKRTISTYMTEDGKTKIFCHLVRSTAPILSKKP